MRMLLSLALVVPCMAALTASAQEPVSSANDPTRYRTYVRECVDILINSATDRYGEKESPIFVSILDVETRDCPEDPANLDEDFRVVRRGRRNPAGANLLTDQPLIDAMFRLSETTGDARYADAARAYMDYYLKNLVDDKGFFWWGWHRHYDVFTDRFDGHNGNFHEVHSIHTVAWDKLWEVNPDATQREIEAIWQWHVINKETGEINRHGDGKSGCDFSMSAGSFIHAFAFLYTKTDEPVWLEHAKLLADYYHDRRNLDTDLFPERPNAGADRFDGSAFVTAITGCYCPALFEAHELTGEAMFRDYAVAYLKAYAKLGYDEDAGMYWGALKLDGTPIPGPRMAEGYAQYEPRGHLDLWEPYAAGYQFAIYTADASVQAYNLTRDAEFLTAAKRFAEWIARTPPGSVESENTWYAAYTEGPAKQGTYAGKYGRTVSFLLHLHEATQDDNYLSQAKAIADVAIAKLHHKGLFRGHPAKPYYEAMDGVGYLLCALLELDAAMK